MGLNVTPTGSIFCQMMNMLVGLLIPLIATCVWPKWTVLHAWPSVRSRNNREQIRTSASMFLVFCQTQTAWRVIMGHSVDCWPLHSPKTRHRARPTRAGMLEGWRHSTGFHLHTDSWSAGKENIWNLTFRSERIPPGRQRFRRLCPAAVEWISDYRRIFCSDGGNVKTSTSSVSVFCCSLSWNGSTGHTTWGFCFSATWNFSLQTIDFKMMFFLLSSDFFNVFMLG